MKNNKGFSLLELIIAFALLSIVSAMVVGFISASSSAFRNVNSEVSLQYESQVTLGQLQEYLIDCSGGVTFDNGGKVLYILNKEENADGSASHRLHTVQQIEDKLYYDAQPVTYDAGAHTLNYYGLNPPYYDPDLMASGVTSFTVTFDTSGTDTVSATKAHLTIAFVKNGKTYTGTQDVAFRNNVLYNSISFDSLATAVLTEG